MPEEPVEPKPPPHAFTLFAKSKWSVLVDEKKQAGTSEAHVEGFGTQPFSNIVTLREDEKGKRENQIVDA